MTSSSKLDFANANLAGAVFRNARLRKADFRSANLIGADFEKADLADACLFDASLRGANLAGACLAGASLVNADLTDANLADANLAGAKLAGANLIGVKGLATREEERAECARILRILESGEGNLNMNMWHTCETTHCLAGWCVPDETYPGATASRRIPSLAYLFYVHNGHDEDPEDIKRIVIDALRRVVNGASVLP